MSETIEGILCILATPFRKDWTINYDALKDEIDWCRRRGAHGIIATGSAGEYTSVTNEERREFHKRCIDLVPSNFRTVACTSAADTLQAVDLSKNAQELGYDAVMVTPPYYWHCTADEVRRHYEALSNQAD